ncbi:hypothetical protein BDZ89DRAFT_1073255 [Hymenopellis radicata]|nr:hypothetical protein BDZ89DRAFT_1073255 [Hymenopellis radicata]
MHHIDLKKTRTLVHSQDSFCSSSHCTHSPVRDYPLVIVTPPDRSCDIAACREQLFVPRVRGSRRKSIANPSRLHSETSNYTSSAIPDKLGEVEPQTIVGRRNTERRTSSCTVALYIGTWNMDYCC